MIPGVKIIFAFPDGTFSSEGMKPLLKELDLTHLRIDDCNLQLHMFSTLQTAIQNLTLRNVKMDAGSLTKLIQCCQKLKRFILHCVEMIDEHVYEICAACPRLEFIHLRRKFLHFPS